MPIDLKNKKHLFFDLDDTVTLSRSLLEEEYVPIYKNVPCDIIVTTGAQSSQIAHQTRDLPIYRLGQNGNQAIAPDDTVLWEEKLTEGQTKVILDHIEKLKAVCDLEYKDENDLIENRGSQISYSLIGHHEDVAKKKACDPDHAIRQSLLLQVHFEHPEVEVKIAGTTCFDYFQKGRHKGYNVKKLIDYMGWNPDECVYFGDALFPGGNDHVVVGVIDTYPVKNHHETAKILKEFYTK